MRSWLSCNLHGKGDEYSVMSGRFCVAGRSITVMLFAWQHEAQILSKNLEGRFEICYLSHFGTDLHPADIYYFCNSFSICNLLFVYFFVFLVRRLYWQVWGFYHFQQAVFAKHRFQNWQNAEILGFLPEKGIYSYGKCKCHLTWV